MDDQQFGTRIRAARLRRGWRQLDLARAAGVSDATVSRLERGHVGSMSLDVLRRVAAALEIRAELLPRSRAGDLDRLVNARHAALAESVLARFAGLGTWVARPEVSFSVYGERGIVDVLCWHPASRALLVIELKTEIVDVGELLGTLDRKRRLAAAIARPLGWRPVSVSAWLIVGEGRTNRRRLEAHRATFRAALPADGRAVRGWLDRPDGELLALSTWPNRHGGTVRSGFAAVRRVRRPGARSS
ncbi:MAG TPA: helix-turn-helix transcriptional regulator [Candidatus Limnocylindrales bacterium]|nr:helix-turn-helix transcriptional regulator [Candidatus Limnocylindrales bacterium]